jgi:hypothetical protein
MIAVIYVDFVLSITWQHCLYHQRTIDTRSAAKEESWEVLGSTFFYRNLVDSRVRLVCGTDGSVGYVEWKAMEGSRKNERYR